MPALPGDHPDCATLECPQFVAWRAELLAALGGRAGPFEEALWLPGSTRERNGVHEALGSHLGVFFLVNCSVYMFLLTLSPPFPACLFSPFPTPAGILGSTLGQDPLHLLVDFPFLALVTIN